MKNSTSEVYYLRPPNFGRIPFVLSIPHCGIQFPENLVDKFDSDRLGELDDTDWFLDRLYDFASDLGITMIFAKYSRWVIDLNRDPVGEALYYDGRKITELCPKESFLGQRLYKNLDDEPTRSEIEKRLETYFYPYHKKIDSLIGSLKEEFGDVLFWDAHSIRRNVKSIRNAPFPDLIFGDNDQKTASYQFIEAALESLGDGNMNVAHNSPFKGGYLTRSKGAPNEGIHALQLEMTKDLYMSDNETKYDTRKAHGLKSLLKTTFENLIALLNHNI